MAPAKLKSLGYLISTVSVGLLGWTAWPGAEKAGLTPVLFGGMLASVVGMACRWYSYEMEKKAPTSRPEKPCGAGISLSKVDGRPKQDG